MMLKRRKTRLGYSRRAYKQKDHARSAEISLAKGWGNISIEPYMPFIPIHRFAGSGFSTRLCCPVSKDIIHCHSLGESAYARLLMWTPGHRRLYSQVALPRQHTLQIAESLGIRHPRYPDGTLCVMTTDFLQLLEIDGKRQFRAISVKANKPKSKRKLELLKLEEEYWASKNVSCHLCLKSDASRTILSNIRYVESFVGVSDLIWGSHKWNEYEAPLYLYVQQGYPPTQAARIVEARLGMPKGSGLSLFRFFIANRIWEINWSIELNPLKPLTILERSVQI